MKPLSVLIVEDDPAACAAFTKYVDTLDDVVIAATTKSASEALMLIRDHLPHVIILDLELHHGSGSGFDILLGIKGLNLDVSPYVLVTTNNTSAVTYEYARQLGTDYIMSKHQADYSEQGVIDFLRLMADVIKDKWRLNHSENAVLESPNQRKKRIENRINTELDNVGISPKVKGRQYLIDAIQLVMEEPRPHICDIVGLKYGKTDSSVERAMQNAIGAAWKTTDIDELYTHYTAKIRSDKGVPSVTEFIYYYANKLKQEY